MTKPTKPTGNVYEVNIDDFCTPDGKYFDFDMLSKAVDSGKLKPIGEEMEDDADIG
jgi:hypothetical protein